jgi:uncharacterized protein YabN with tetrapyrrole methylase and pyrophosphatase domain
MSIKEMTKKQLAVWATYPNQGTIPWTFETAIQDLPYQIGAISKIYLQMKNYRYRDGLNEAQLKERMADELADVLSEVFFIAHELNIDLEQAFNDMLSSDENKIAKRSKA